METHDTLIGLGDTGGKHTIVMDFSSKNSFGGHVRSEAIDFIDTETCRAILADIG